MGEQSLKQQVLYNFTPSKVEILFKTPIIVDEVSHIAIQADDALQSRDGMNFLFNGERYMVPWENIIFVRYPKEHAKYTIE